MSSRRFQHLQLLTGEAIRDSIRRKIVLVLLVVCFFFLTLVNSCTSCNFNLQLSGSTPTTLDFVGWAGVVTFCLVSLWTIVLAGLLASDQLAQSLVDGSALLVLSRPVARDTVALSRLAGSLAVSLGAGLIVLGGTAMFLSTRSGLPLGPALLAMLACGLSCVMIAALSMTASLYLPRVASFMVITLMVGVIGTINLTSISTGGVTGFYAAIDQYGPPLASSIVLALTPWSQYEPEGLGAFGVVLRLLVWAGFCVWLLLYNFRHQEA